MDALKIRWAIRVDMPAIMRIEQASFDDPWTETEFLQELRNKNVICQVAERHGSIVGFMLYEMGQSRYVLMDLAVHTDWRRRGVGSALVEKLADKMSVGKRKKIAATVSEEFLQAQLFFRACGFKAVRVVRGPFIGSDRDAYKMERRLVEVAAE